MEQVILEEGQKMPAIPVLLIWLLLFFYWLDQEEEEKQGEREYRRKAPERARLAELERQRILAKTKKREEEERQRLLGIAKQVKTVAGLKKLSPSDFESAVASLYEAIGYKAHLTPGSGGQGIDVVLTKDTVRIAVKCKRYSRSVPISHIRDFYGAFSGVFSSGIFVTSATFSRNTYDWTSQRKELELVDGEQLAKLFAEHRPEFVRDFEPAELPALSKGAYLHRDLLGGSCIIRSTH
jgi:restriction endonuclease Mrr